MKRWKRAFLICFVGMDGSGKTTQAQALVSALKTARIESRYVHNRFVAFLTWPLIIIGKNLFFRRKGKLEDYDQYCITRRRVFANRPLAATYQYLLLLDYLLQSTIRVRFPLVLGRSLVCDRYIYDTVVDLTVDLNYPAQKMEKVLKRSLSWLPKPDLVFLMTVPEEKAYQRKDDIPSLDFLKERRKIYLNMAARYGMTIVDGSGEPEELQQTIQNKVKAVM